VKRVKDILTSRNKLKKKKKPSLQITRLEGKLKFQYLKLLVFKLTIMVGQQVF